jgi:hypothetical protein
MTRDEAIHATRQHFAEVAQACIEEAASGNVHVNDLNAYTAWQHEMAADSLAGKFDHTFSHQQHVHFLLTGECRPLLP